MDLYLAVDGSRRGQPMVLLASAPGEVVWTATPTSGGAALVAGVREALQFHRGAIVAVAAVRGPGSYMGVRAALAAALGAAQALRAPLSVLGALEVVAWGSQPDPALTLALSDAGRGGTYGQLVKGDLEGATWATAGPAQLLGSNQPWPGDWSAAEAVVGQPGEGRLVGAGLRRLPVVRERAGALAWAVARGGAVNSGYDRVTADYGQALGAG